MKWRKGLIVGVILLLPAISIPVWIHLHRPSKEYLEKEIVAAARGGNKEEVASLLKRGADPNSREIKESRSGSSAGLYAEQSAAFRQETRRQSQTVLSLAATGRKRTELVKLLLDHGASIQQDDECMLPAIVQSARQGDLQTVQLLLDRGAAVNTTNAVGLPPIEAAVLSRNVALVRLLLERGANPRAAGVTAKMAKESPEAAQIRDLLQAAVKPK